jgi:hypothetical protein
MPDAGDDPLLLFRQFLQLSSGVTRRLECSYCILISGIYKPEEFFLAFRCTLDLIGNTSLSHQTREYSDSNSRAACKLTEALEIVLNE